MPDGTNKPEDEVLVTTKRGNKLTKTQWNDIQNAPNKMWATSTPQEYMSWVDGWAKPEPIDAAEVAARAFLKTPKAIANNYQATQGVSRGMNGSFNTYPISPAQNRASDSTQFVNNYYAANGIKEPVISPEQRLMILKRLQGK